MVTPSRAEILEKARELFMENSVRNGIEPISPTVEELRESGFISAAQSELMRDQSKAMIEEYFTNEDQVIDDPFEVDVDEAMCSGLYVTGGRQCGKTTLACRIAYEMRRNGIVVFAIDPTQQWSRKLELPTIVLPSGGVDRLEWNDESTVFDTSRFHSDLQQLFCEKFCKAIMEVAISRTTEQRPQIFVWFEEAHTPMPNNILNSKKFRETKRLLTQGANFNVSFGAITQFSSMVDKLPVKAAQQRYFGKSSEPNDLKYLRDFLGKRVDELPNLEVGQFVYQYAGRKTVRIKNDISSLIATERLS